MASDVLKYALLAGAGFVAYRWLSTPSTAAPPPTGSNPVSLADLIAALRNPSTPPPAGTPAATALADQLTAAAAGNAYLVNGKMTADQWGYIYNHISGKTALDDAMMDALFFPNGRPTDDNYTTYTAAEFAAQLKTKGISGLGALRSISLPMAVRGPDGRTRILMVAPHKLAADFVPVGFAR